MRKCDYADCKNRSVVWNDRREYACGYHQNWLARPVAEKKAA